MPFTLLRAAQFHDFVLSLVQRVSVSPVLTVPTGMRLQPVDADEVAARLVELASGPPAGVMPDLPGPQTLPLTDLVRSYLTAAGKRRLVMSLPLPGPVGRAYREGANLSSDTPTGTRPWQDFLTDRALT